MHDGGLLSCSLWKRAAAPPSSYADECCPDSTNQRGSAVPLNIQNNWTSSVNVFRWAKRRESHIYCTASRIGRCVKCNSYNLGLCVFHRWLISSSLEALFHVYYTMHSYHILVEAVWGLFVISTKLYPINSISNMSFNITQLSFLSKML